MLIMTENAALEFAGYGHSSLACSFGSQSETYFNRRSEPAQLSVCSSPHLPAYSFDADKLTVLVEPKTD
jgi:hypothetical protein